MPGKLQPLGNNIRIVNPDGTPTDYFTRWAQQRQIDIGAGITAAQAQALVDDFAAGRKVIAGHGLSGGGALSSDVTLALDAGLGDLSDVNLSTPPTDGQILIYDAASHKWKPGDQSGGGGGSQKIWGFSGLGTDDFGQVTATATGSYSGTPNNSLGISPVTDFYWNGGSQLTFDFGSAVKITGLGIFSDRNGSSQGFWQFSTSDDGVTFTNVGTPVEWTGATRRTMIFGAAGSHRYYRMTQTSGVSNNSQYQTLFLFRWG